MRSIVAGFALLAPAIALSEPCNMADFQEVDRQYIAVAPACVASGDYSSAKCASINELNDRWARAIKDHQVSGCEEPEYVDDPALMPMREKVLELERASLIAKEDAAEALSKKPDYGDRICKQLMADIARKYDLVNLKHLPNRVDISSSPIIPCTYEANRPTVSGNLAVIVLAELNRSNKRYRLTIR